MRHVSFEPIQNAQVIPHIHQTLMPEKQQSKGCNMLQLLFWNC